MTLTYIAVFSLGALLYGWLVPARWRGWVLMVVSAAAVYLLQPALPIRFLDFILPTVTLTLTVMVWWVTSPHPPTPSPSGRGGEQRSVATFPREDRIALAVVVAITLLMSANRYLAAEVRLTPSRPPDTLAIALALIVIGAIFAGLWRLGSRWMAGGALLLIAALFIVIKTEPLAAAVSGWLRGQTGQDTSLASQLDLGWLGFSYIAFRLIHTLRDRQSGKLPALSLREFLTYIVFFPSLTAGPIDRAERFTSDDRALPTLAGLDASRIVQGGLRIATGLLKKFILADSLALMALNSTNALQVNSTPWLWVLLYGYAFQLVLDFSGYSDIAIGIGILYGVRLPENFDRPYLKQNMTTFWQSWHATLSSWARFYVFTPLSRFLLTRKRRPSPLVIVFSAQMATMLVIGLWHGVTPNFIVWGVWHGIGLFIHKVWSDRTRPWYLKLKDHPRRQRAWTIAGILLTFHFVLLGWVFFALPDLASAGRVFSGLIGRW